jgi:hypothetical protein
MKDYDLSDNAQAEEWRVRVLNGDWCRIERYQMWAEDFLSLVLRTPNYPNVLDQPELVPWARAG